jgi:ABC-type transport system substrate-binding protein
LEITSVASYAMFVEVLQAQLSAIGINVKVNITDSPGLADMVTNNKIEALVYNKTCGPEGDNMRNVLVDGQGANRVRYANPRNEELLNLALGETNEAARLGYYQEIQEIVREDCYYIPLGYPVTHALYNSKLSGVIWNANQKHDYTHVVCAE